MITATLWKKVVTEATSWLSWWRESVVLFPIVAIVVWAIIAVVIPALTGREAVLDVGVLGDYAMRLVGIAMVIATIGFLKGKSGILPDVDEKHASWQLVAVDAISTVCAICFLSWLLLR